MVLVMRIMIMLIVLIPGASGGWSDQYRPGADAIPERMSAGRKEQVQQQGQEQEQEQE